MSTLISNPNIWTDLENLDVLIIAIYSCGCREQRKHKVSKVLSKFVFWDGRNHVEHSKVSETPSKTVPTWPGSRGLTKLLMNNWSLCAKTINCCFHLLDLTAWACYLQRPLLRLANSFTYAVLYIINTLSTRCHDSSSRISVDTRFAACAFFIPLLSIVRVPGPKPHRMVHVAIPT